MGSVINSVEQASETFYMRSRKAGVWCWSMLNAGVPRTSSLLSHGLVKVLRERVVGSQEEAMDVWGNGECGGNMVTPQGLLGMI